MTLEQRAQQFWPVLVFAASHQKVISASMLSQITGYLEAPGPVLYYIHCYCRLNDLPPLDAIVIDPVTGRPGHECLRDYRDWSTLQTCVFLYDWINYFAPTEEMLAEAVAKQDEIDMANAGYIALPC